METDACLSYITPMPHDFFHADFERDAALTITAQALRGADDGELYLEHTAYESFVWTDGRLKDASFHVDQGFGLRAVAGEFTAYAHGNSLTLPALRAAAATVGSARAGYSGSTDVSAMADAPRTAAAPLYGAADPTGAVPLEAKIALLAEIDAYVRAAEPLVRQVSVSLATEYKLVSILRPGSDGIDDARPLSRLNITVTLKRGDRTEEGSFGFGGREALAGYIAQDRWRHAADQALRQARVNLDSVAAPAGEQTVVLANGWAGVLFHEAVGHGLEGDFIRKGTSMFSGKVGTQVAAKGVTVIDDGSLAGRRGSLTVDDEGTPTQRNVLIEDGILKGFMQDRLNARLMQQQPTGNGRRESYASMPMPRMTNTFLDNGKSDPQEIIASVKDGIYAVDFGGGSVDITSGRFVFSMTEAYKIENGKLTAPLKGATLIGSGADTLHRISMIGNDLDLDRGIATCGKEGQGVPAGVGQPTLRLDGMTVGGAA